MNHGRPFPSADPAPLSADRAIIPGEAGKRDAPWRPNHCYSRLLISTCVRMAR
jgi:hypothetical protein